MRDASDHASDIALSFFVASIQTLLAKGDTLQREATNNVVLLSRSNPHARKKRNIERYDSHGMK